MIASTFYVVCEAELFSNAGMVLVTSFFTELCLCTLIDNNICYHSDRNVVDSVGYALRFCNKF